MVTGKTGRLLSCFVSIAMVVALVPIPALAEVADEAALSVMDGEGEPLLEQLEDDGQDAPTSPTATVGEPASEEALDGEPTDTTSGQGEEESGESAPAAFDQSLELDGVTVRVTASEGAFPASATLYVERVSQPELEAAEEAIGEARGGDANVARSYSFDIAVLAEDGSELQPADGRDVSVSFTAPEVADVNLDTQVYHLSEELGGPVAEELEVATEGADTAVVETGGFSVYTVEFTYDKLSYVMAGDTEVPLADIVAAVGLVGDPEAVEVSNESLYSASKESGAWVIFSHGAFDSQEWLRVTINGIDYQIAVTDDAAPRSVKYLERTWDQESGTVVETTEPSPEDTRFFPTSPENNTLEPGWYYLNENVTIDGRLAITGDTQLILAPNAKLDVKGIYVEWGTDLTIYNQVGISGEIVSHPDSGPGIGSSDLYPGGHVIIKGGTVTATGANQAAGIGSNYGDNDNFGSIEIYGGKVMATGGDHGAGIGGGHACEGDDIAIYGGEVIAQGGHWAAGIGGGDGEGKPIQGGHAGEITIRGGTITATGGDDGAGIGGGEGGNAGEITIHGGTITAKGGNNGAGIGCGEGESTGKGGTVTIDGGTITATGGDDGAGIGGGEDGNCTIQISDGTVYAYHGGDNGAAIGGGKDADGGTITIGGDSEVWAYGEGENGAAIGGGDSGDGGTITICGSCTVYAYSRDGARIGGGDGGDGGTINIGTSANDMCSIEAHYVEGSEGNGAGIGGGQDGDGEIINIRSGFVHVSGNRGAGIGGGRATGDRVKDSGAGGKITISGGSVEAVSNNAFGIGAGGIQTYGGFNSNYVGSAGTITISGSARVKSWGFAAGIGGDGGKLTIKDNCNVLASGFSNADYGHGIVFYSDSGNHFEMSGGVLNAIGVDDKPGIRLESGTLKISGGSLYAKSPTQAIFIANKKKIDYYPDALFMIGPSKEEAKPIAAADRSFTYNDTEKSYENTSVTDKKKYRYVSITPCKHTNANDQGLCPNCMQQIYPVKYIERSWNGSKVIEVEKDSPEGTKDFPTSGTVQPGWYYVKKNTTIDKRVTLTGDTHLILGDGNKLDLKGLYVPAGSTLTIYGQAEDTGVLKSHPSAGAAIGAYDGHKGGDVIIEGGTIEATGHDHCAGIGGNDGDGTEVGSFTMYGGTVTAKGGSNGAGVGGGRECDSGKIVIYGGILIAAGKNDSAGIGGGDSDNATYGNADSISIYGGIVTATCPGKGAAIGGADYGTANVVIRGGEIKATCSGSGTGIGGGTKKAPDESTITLGYTLASRADISITASSYGGTVTLEKRFLSGDEVIEAGVAQNDAIAGKTLKAWEGAGSSWDRLQREIDAAADGATIILQDDVTATEYDECLIIEKAITLDLNGHTLNRNGDAKGAERDGSAIHVTSQGSLTIIDSSGGEGCITGGRGGKGGAIRNEGTLEIQGGTISGNTAQRGAGVYTTGTFNFVGGSIEGNTATLAGGGVYVLKGTVTISGGNVSGNNAVDTTATEKTVGDGGGIYVEGGKVFLESATVSDNTARNNGGGIFITEFGHLYLQGSTALTGNVARNGGGIYMDGGWVNLEGTSQITGNDACGFKTETDSDEPTMTGSCGGIYYYSGTLSMKDAPQVTGNTATGAIEGHGASDIGIFAGVRIEIVGELTYEGESALAKVALQTEDGSFRTGTFTMYYDNHNGGVHPSTHFQTEDGLFVIHSPFGEAEISDEPQATEPTFRTHSLLLDGAIGVKFFMELPAMEGVDYEKSYMEFSVSGRGGKVTTDPFDAQDRNQWQTFYGFTCYVSSIQMADTITATFHYFAGGEERVVSQDYSIARYVEEFDGRLAESPGAFDDTTVRLVHALADYGHYAQPYLSAVHGWKIGSDYAEMPASGAVTDQDVEDVRAKAAGYAAQVDVPAGGEALRAGVGLDLTSDTVAYLSVTTSGGASVASAALADGTPLELVRVAGDRWRALVPGIMAHHLGDRFDVVVTTSGGTVVRARLAAVSLAQAMFDSAKYGGDADALRMVAALWRYWEAADAYMEAHA